MPISPEHRMLQVSVLNTAQEALCKADPTTFGAVAGMIEPAGSPDQWGRATRDADFDFAVATAALTPWDVPMIRISRSGYDAVCTGDTFFEPVGNATNGFGQPNIEQASYVISASANDDGDPAGTGVRNIRVIYLDGNWDVGYEDVQMNGVGQPAMTATILRVLQVVALDWGTVGMADGDIEVRWGDHGVNDYAFAQIQAGYRRSLSGRFWVPRNTKLLLNSVQIFNSSVDTAKLILTGYNYPITVFSKLYAKNICTWDTSGTLIGMETEVVAAGDRIRRYITHNSDSHYVGESFGTGWEVGMDVTGTGVSGAGATPDLMCAVNWEGYLIGT